ncbi:MAG: DUF120 domain-containing protein [Candidatus Aenigmatarchaeota archaeon]
MKLKGEVVSGVHRGKPLIRIYHLRLTGILGFEPFKGTLDIKMEKPIDIRPYSTKAIEQVLLDGTKKVDAYLAPVILSFKGQSHICWAMRHETIYSSDTIEIVSKDKLKEKMSLKDGDEVEITFTEEKKKEKSIPGMEIMKRLYGRETHLMKS